MDFYEMDKMWHDIREKIAKEEELLSLEERVARAKKFTEEASKKYGLTVTRANRRGRK